ncbi:pLS20_p028 family conjugation system transmembrane protein [Lactococcus lactis]|uniref:pLS20_p028 family conjugation system transmembrane protein n=1 Tax=Lactococcus lactis TaxID=1358 RepID=UPI0022DF93FA|nr:hypothetical protein [Lactococcus lactis]
MSRVKLQFKNLKQRITGPRLVLLIMLGLFLFPMTGLADTTVKWGLPIGGGGLGTGGGDVTNTAQAILFYQYFHTYLTPHIGLVAIMVSVIGGGLGQGLAHLVDGLQTVFYSTINLMGLFNDLSDSKTPLGIFFSTTQKLGIIILGLSIVIYAVFVIFNGKSKIFRAILQTVFLTTLVVSFIPWMVNQSVTLTKDSIQATADNTGQQSIALNLIQNNVVDKYALNAKNWDVTLNSDGSISKVSDYNNITSIDDWDPGEIAGVINDSTLSSLDKGKASNDATALVIFEHALVKYPKRTSLAGKIESEQKIKTITYHKTITASNYTELNYLRYKVNWVPFFLSLLAVGFLFVTMSIKVVLSIVQITITTIAAPVLAAIKARHVKKVKELISGIFHGIAGIYFDFLIVGVAVAIMTWLTTTTVFTDAGLPGLASSLLKTAAFIGVFFGVFSGVGVVEKFLGVSSGHGNALKQILAAGMITRGVLGMSRAGVGLGGAIASGFKDNFSNAKEWHEQQMQRQQLQMMPQSAGPGSGGGRGSETNPSGVVDSSEGSNPKAAPTQNSRAGQTESNRRKEAEESLEKERQTQHSAPKQEQPNFTTQNQQTSQNGQSQQKQGAKSTFEPGNPREDLTQERAQQNNQQTYQNAQEGVHQKSQEPGINRVDQLEQKMEKFDKNRERDQKQQQVAQRKQKQSTRVQQASQNLNQGFQNMQQMEPHIGSAEDEE